MNRKQIAIAIAIAAAVSLLIFVISRIISWIETAPETAPETPPVTPPTPPLMPPITPITQPVITSEITFTYDGGTHPVFDLIAEQGYDRDNLRRIIIDYLNGHPDKATLCGSANCNINNLH